MIGPIAKPDEIIFTPDLPKTRSGKIMRRLLRDVARGNTLGDVTTLANAEIVEQIHEQVAVGGAARSEQLFDPGPLLDGPGRGVLRRAARRRPRRR